MLTFLALGDFPRSHDKLGEVISNVREHGPDPTHRDGFPFNWLRGFTRVVQAEHGVRQPPAQASNRGSFQHMIVEYLDRLGVREADRRLREFGSVLVSAKPLRNDSNYEALLIAHEYRHVAMTTAFDRLAERMTLAAESSLPLAVDAFNCFLRGGPELGEKRREYESFLYELLHRRVQPAIQQKLCGFPGLAEKLLQIVALIDARQTNAPYQQIEDWVSMGIFGEKARLMRDFETKIESLRLAADTLVKQPD